MSVRFHTDVIVLSDDGDSRSENVLRHPDLPDSPPYPRTSSNQKLQSIVGNGRLQGLKLATDTIETGRKRRCSEGQEESANQRSASFFETFTNADFFQIPEKNAENQRSPPQKHVQGISRFADSQVSTRRARNILSAGRRTWKSVPIIAGDHEPADLGNVVVIIDSDDDYDNLQKTITPSVALEYVYSSSDDSFHDISTALQQSEIENALVECEDNNEVNIIGQGAPQNSDLLVHVIHKDSRTDKSDLKCVDDESTDDDIAILSREEAESIDTFKRTSFVAPFPDTSNQPVSMHYVRAPTDTTRIDTTADLAVRNYFMRYTVLQLQNYERNLEASIGSIQGQMNAYFAQVQNARAKLSMLAFDQTTLKDQLNLLVSDHLQLADVLLENMKKTRRYLFILQSVKNSKLAPTESHIATSSNTSQTAEVASVYIHNANPYVNRSHRADHADLEHLFKDVCCEEKIEGMAPTPEALTIQLLDHQRRGLFWLLGKEKTRSGCILADDMGLGKTVQTLAVMMANRPLNPTCKTTLIVGPVSLLRQWDAEIQSKIKPAHSLNVAFYHGSEKRRLGTFSQISEFDVVLTSYTTLASEFKQHFGTEMKKAHVTNNSNALPPRGTGGQCYVSPLYSPDANFYRIVLDEAQYIRNKLSQASKATACLRGEHRLCLTGTPMQNNIEELFPILRFLESRPYGDEKKFKLDISVPLKSSSDNFDDYDRNQSMRKLRAVLSVVMLRRTKHSKVDGKPLIVLPEKTVDSVYVTMEREELEYYNALEKGIQKKARKLMASANHDTNSFLTLLLRLRQACVHQLLVQVGELNSQENSASFQGKNWKLMYQRVLEMRPAVRAIVQGLIANANVDGLFVSGELCSRISNEVQLRCPVCLDVVGEDSIIIFANCGHMICNKCISSFLHGDSEGSDRETTDCLTCNTIAASSDFVDYGLYAKVIHEGLDSERLERLYGMSNTKKSSNLEKVKFLIRRNEGFTPSAKMERTLNLIKKITDNTTDEKIIVFSHFTVTFDLLGFALRHENIKYLRYDGSMNIEEKNKTISDFYKGSARVLLISLKAGNMGLTLTCASHVVIMDPFWNPYVEDQAMDRAHRFGQERPVKVYRLLIKNSVEDRIIDLQQRKKELIGSALDENALKSSSTLGRRELGYLFGLNSLHD